MRRTDSDQCGRTIIKLMICGRCVGRHAALSRAHGKPHAACSIPISVSTSAIMQNVRNCLTLLLGDCHCPHYVMQNERISDQRFLFSHVIHLDILFGTCVSCDCELVGS